MDVLDKKIICLIERDCRLPVSKIGKKLRTNRNTINYRLNKLKGQKIIQRYITSINLGKLGYISHKIYFKISDFARIEELILHLKEKKELIHLLQLQGEYNLSCVIATKNLIELDNFLTEIRSTFKDLVGELSVSAVVYSRIFKFEKLLLGKKDETLKFEKYSSKEKTVKLDEIDEKILHVLSQEANISYIDLAKETNLSLDIIKYRMKKLKKEIISSFRTLLDLNKFGYYHYVFLLKTKNLTKEAESHLITWCTLKKEVLYCTKRIGNFDFEVNAAFKTLDEMNDFVNFLQREFAKNIDSYTTILISKIIKLNYIPF